MKISKKLGLILCTMITVGAFAGCGSKSTSNKTKKVAVIVKSTDAPYWQTVKKGAEVEAKKDGIDMYFVGAAGGETDVNGQVNLVETAVNQKVDGIVLAPSDSAALAPIVNKAIAAGIAVVIIDSSIDTDKYISYATTNNEDAAYKVGKKLGELTKGKGTVAILGFQPGAGSNTAREKGFKKAIAEFPEMKIVATQYSQSDKTKALSVTEDMLTANPKLTAIFAANEPSLVGAARAFKEKNIKNTILVGFDSSDDVIPLIKEGIIKAAAVQMPYTMGGKGIEQLANKFTGKTVNKSIDTGVSIVTPENMNNAESQKAIYPLK